MPANTAIVREPEAVLALPGVPFGGSEQAIEPLRAEEFKAAFRGQPGGVALITAIGEGGPVALTATSVASVSANPPLLVFSVSALASAAPTITTAETVVVHLLDAQHLDLARLGATSGIDRFADTRRWALLPAGEPTFHGPTWLRCAVINQLQVGTATIVIAQPVETNLRGERDNADRGALVYHSHRWHRLGDESLIEEYTI